MQDDNGRMWRLVDVLAIAVALTLCVFLVGDWEPGADDGVEAVIGGVRAVAALSFFLFVPGWMMVRVVGLRPSSLTLVTAFVASVGGMIATSFLMATLDAWAWRAAGLGWAAVSVAGLLVADRVRSAERRVPFVEGEA